MATNNEKIIWDFLKQQGLTDAGVAGLMGNLFAESNLQSNNLQNTYQKKLGYTDETYTAAVDNGTYNNFIKDSAGYGLAQWTHWSRKEALLKFAQSSNASIGDMTMQLNYLIKELKSSYKSVISVLQTTTSVKDASDIVLVKFERPADQSETAKNRRYQYSMKYYNQFVNQEPITPTPVTPTTPTTIIQKQELTQEQFNQMMDVWIAEQAKKQPGDWSKEAREWGERNGLIKGNSNGEGMYKKPMTREEFIVVLYRALHRLFIQ